jgi:phage portal protein BeeE
MTVYGGLAPREYEVDASIARRRFSPDEIVHFRGYNPESSTIGLSPLETLRRILAEEHAMGQYREHFWQNSARMSGIIERPADAPEWREAARARFKEEFEALYSGTENSGQTAIWKRG